MTRRASNVKHSLSEIEALRKRGRDLTRTDAPSAISLGEKFWKSARIVAPKASETKSGNHKK